MTSKTPRAFFTMSVSANVVPYWTTPTTTVTVAAPVVAYAITVGPKKYKQVKTYAEIRSRQ